MIIRPDYIMAIEPFIDKPLVSFILVAIRIIQRWFAELKVVREKDEKGDKACRQQ